MQPIRSSYKTVDSRVFSDQMGGIFRSVPFEPDIYNSLGVFPKLLNRVEAGLFEVEKVDFFNYYYEWTFGQFRDSAVFYLELLKKLHLEGWGLVDATPLNITYQGNRGFIFIDHGSLIRQEAHWTSYLQFIREYAYPLLYLADAHIDAPQMLLPLINDKSWPFQFRPSFGKRFSLKYQVLRSALIISTRKSLADTKPERDIRSDKKFIYNIEFFLDFVKSLQQKKTRTKWDNYYTDTIIKGDYLSTKIRLVKEFLSGIAAEVRFAVDFGASDGLFSAEVSACAEHLQLISIESDPGASAELYKRSSTGKITPVFANLLQLTPAAGFHESLPSLGDRLRQVNDLSIALGVIHHMMHEENLPFERIIEYFFDLSRSGAYLLIEYIGVEDPRYKLIRNPNYPHPQDLDSFRSALSSRFEIINENDIIHDRRLFLAKKK